MIPSLPNRLLTSIIVIQKNLTINHTISYTETLNNNYTFATMGLRLEQKKNVNFTYYEAGHMLYIHKPSLIQVKADADKMYTGVIEQINSSNVKP